MRRSFCAAALFCLLISGCSSKFSDPVPFFCDVNFARIARISPSMLTKNTEAPLFKMLEKMARKAGVKLNFVEINDMEARFLPWIQASLPADRNIPVIIVSRLYEYSDVAAALEGRNVFIVGPALDVNTDAARILGGGLDAVKEEGAEVAALGKEIAYLMPGNKFQNRIEDAFSEGAEGVSIHVFPIKMESTSLSSQTIEFLSKNDAVVIAAYGRYFKQIPGTGCVGAVRLVNYPGNPDMMDSAAKRKVKGVLRYDFVKSFETALLNIEEKGTFYSLELVR